MIFTQVRFLLVFFFAMEISGQYLYNTTRCECSNRLLVASKPGGSRVLARGIPDVLKKTQQEGWHPPPHAFTQRQWHWAITNNPVYIERTRNTQVQFAPVLNGLPNGSLQDISTYQDIKETGPSKIYSLYGIETPVEGLHGAYITNGTGTLSSLYIQFAYLAWGRDSTGDDYLVTYLGPIPGSGVNFASELDIVTQSKTGPTAETVEAIKSALIEVKDATMTPAFVEKLKRIPGDDGRDNMPPVAATIGVIQNAGNQLIF
jgi:hypothetical protein